MSRSYRKTPKSYPAHLKYSSIGALSWKKSYRRLVNRSCDLDGTPVLPHKIGMGWPLSHGGGRWHWFGCNTYEQRVYSIRVIGGNIVSTIPPDEELWPGYIGRQLRKYRNK